MENMIVKEIERSKVAKDVGETNCQDPKHIVSSWTGQLDLKINKVPSRYGHTYTPFTE